MGGSQGGLEPQEFPWQRYLQIAGAMGWTPDIFWRSTLCEFKSMFEGWREANGDGSERDDKEMAELRRLTEEELLQEARERRKGLRK
ncbi:MAG TPA: phage tail assembly chaperone [Alphaproteobacteria bacterium]|nr:phage tail assembly chaperone [Alphaproteobacteria bacterium]